MPNPTDEELAVALVAGMTSANLKKVDETTVNKGTAGPANKLNPFAFLKKKQAIQDDERQRIQDLIRV